MMGLTRYSGRISALLLALAVTVIALPGLANLELKASFTDAMGPHDADARVQRMLEANFPGSASLTVVIEGERPEALVEAAHTVETALADVPAVSHVFLEQPARDAALFRPPEALQAHLDTVDSSADALGSLLEAPSLSTGLGLVIADLDHQLRPDRLPPSDAVFAANIDRLNASLAFLEHPGEATPDALLGRFAGGLTPAQQLDLSPDGKVLVFEVATADPNAVVATLAALDHRLPHVQISATGEVVQRAQERGALVGDLEWVTLAGVLGVLAVFALGFRRWTVAAAAMVPVALGVLWTLGLVGFVYGDVTLFALAVPVILVGLGIDFSIHVVSAFAEHGDIKRALKQVGPGLVVGALTSAAAFLVLMESSFYGIRELGFAAGSGLIAVLLATLLCLVPVLSIPRMRPPDLPFRSLHTLGEIVEYGRHLFLAVLLGITLWLGSFAGQVQLDRDYQAMLPNDLPSVRAHHVLLEHFGASRETITFLAQDLAHATELASAARTVAGVGSVVSPSDFIPTEQDRKAELIVALQTRLDSLPVLDAVPLAEQLERLGAQLQALRRQHGPSTDALGPARDAVNRLIALRDPHTLDADVATAVTAWTARVDDELSQTQLTEADLPPAIQARLGGLEGGWLVLVRPSGDLWDANFRDRFMEELEDTVHADLAGSAPMWHRMLEKIDAEIGRMALLIGLAITFLVFLHQRSIRGVVLAVAPVTVGLVWMTGLLGWAGLELNILSVMALPIVLGIGIDDGVHLLGALRTYPTTGLALLKTGKPVVLTSLTTAVAFASLGLSMHPGLQSLGLTTALGVLCCLVTSLVGLPALAALFEEQP